MEQFMNMGDDEYFVLIISLLVSAAVYFYSSTSSLHSLFVKNNVAMGLIRCAVPLGLAWILLVLNFYADESVTGIYVFFYFVLGYAQIKIFGQFFPSLLFGVRLRVDIYERKNFAAAIYLAGCTLATALIAGGSVWGDAGPETGDEGGWWIPVSFFILGWLCLLVSTHIFNKREFLNLKKEIVQNRNTISAKRAAAAMIGTAVILTDAVSGDFFGWQSSLVSFFGIAGIHLIHEFISALTAGDHAKDKEAVRGPMSRKEYVIEVLAYIVMASITWVINRIINSYLGF
jgi:hypothetical protein